MPGEQHAKPGSIKAGVVITSVDVTEQLPHVIVRTSIAQEGMVVEDNFLFLYLKIHLKCDLLEASNDGIAHVLDVVVADDQVDFAVQLVQYFVPLCCTSEGEIPQVEHLIILADYAVPVLDQRFVHLLDISKGTIAVPNDA